MKQKTDHDLWVARWAAKWAGDSTGQQVSITADFKTTHASNMILALWMYNARKHQPQVHAMKAGEIKE